LPPLPLLTVIDPEVGKETQSLLGNCSCITHKDVGNADIAGANVALLTPDSISTEAWKIGKGPTKKDKHYISDSDNRWVGDADAF